MQTPLSFCVFRYLGNNKDYNIENPFGGPENLRVGDNKPFLVPQNSKEWFSSLKEFEEVVIPNEDIMGAILNAIDKHKQKPIGNYVKKILFYAPDEGGYTGARYHAYQMALSLAKIGCYVHFLTPSRPPFVDDLGANKNLAFEFNQGLNTSYVGFDIIIAAPPQGLAIAYDKAKREGSLFWPICFEPSEVLCKAVKGFEDQVNINESQYYKSADKIIVNSELTKEQVIELWGVEDKNIIVACPAINLPAIDMVQPVPLGPSIVYVGRAAQFKGLYDVIDLLRIRGKDLPPFTFHVISREADFVKQAKGEGTEKHPIVYHSNISDSKKFSIIKGCNAGIQLSKHEGFGMVPAEFLACKKPVLCLPIPQIKRQYWDMVYYASDEDEICNFIIKAIGNKISARPVGINSARSYTMERMQDVFAGHIKVERINKKHFQYEDKYTGKPRVLFVTKYSYDEPIFGGAESTIKKHAQAMRDVFGFDIFYAFSLDNKHTQYKENKCYSDDFATRFEIAYTPVFGRESKYGECIEEIIDLVSPDIVLTYAEPIHFVGETCIKKRVPYVVSVNFWRCLTDKYDEPESSSPRDLDEIGIKLLNKAIAVIANSEYTAEVIEKLAGRKDSVVIYSPVYPEQVVAQNGTRDCIGITVNENGDARYVLRGIIELLPNEKFLIGQLRGEESCDDIIKSKPNVEYLDGFKDAKEFYSRVKLSLIITPSLSHSFCKTGVEAMLNGIPVVASNKGNLPNLIGDAGVCVGSQVSDWVDEIKKILGNKELYAKYSEIGRERAKKYTDKDTYISGLKKALVDPVVTEEGTLTLECADFPGIQASLRSIEAVVPNTKYTGSNFNNKNLSLLSGWMDGYSRIMNNKKAVMLDWHSPISQSELSGEFVLLIDFLKNIKNHKVKKIFFRDQKTAEALRLLFGEKIHWLPNVIDMDSISKYTSQPYANGFHVSIFCPGHPRKNIMVQAMAAKLAGAHLHINEWIASKHQYLEMIRTFMPEVIVDNLDSYEKLLQTKAKMHVGLEVTWTESFNYSLLEYLALGVPVLASKFTPAFEDIVKDEVCRQWLVIENPGDPIEISEKLQNIKEKGYTLDLKDRVKSCILATAERRNSIAIKELRRESWT